MAKAKAGAATGALPCDEQIKKQERWLSTLERQLEQAKESVKELTAKKKEAGIQLRQLINGQEEPLPFEAPPTGGPRPADMQDAANAERRDWAGGRGRGRSGKDAAAGERDEGEGD